MIEDEIARDNYLTDKYDHNLFGNVCFFDNTTNVQRKTESSTTRQLFPMRQSVDPECDKDRVDADSTLEDMWV